MHWCNGADMVAPILFCDSFPHKTTTKTGEGRIEKAMFPTSASNIYSIIRKKIAESSNFITICER